MSDVVTFPVGIAYASMDSDGGVFLYCNEDKFSKEISFRNIEESCVEVRSYEQIVPDVIEHDCG